jgi:hypothetical protein
MHGGFFFTGETASHPGENLTVGQSHEQRVLFHIYVVHKTSRGCATTTEARMMVAKLAGGG